MEGHVDGKEGYREHGLALREGGLALVKTTRSTDFPEVGNETVESTRWSRHDKDARAIVKGDLQLRILRQVSVGLLDVRLEVLESETCNRKHR